MLSRFRSQRKLRQHWQWIATEGRQGSRLDIPGANLPRVSLPFTDLSYARMQRVNLRKANLHRSDLTHSYLCHANLHYSNLRCTNLRGADLRHADLRGADLRYSNLRQADLRHAKLEGCLGDGVYIKHILNLRYLVAYTATHLQIGCENHSIADWDMFPDCRIHHMDERHALSFWAAHKAQIMELVYKQRCKK